MSSFRSISILLLFLKLVCILGTTHAENDHENLQIYIVHVRPPPSEYTGTNKEWHESFLPNSSRLLHSFSHTISGFSAELTPSELGHIQSLDGFLHASISETLRLHTTYSPSFLHLNIDPSDFWHKDGKYGQGTIIGIMDTGIDPTHPSFDGTHVSKPPSKWKGMCNFSDGNFKCNNKIIGGRDMFRGKDLPIPPYDKEGHGTHVAGIVAGQFVPNANVLGNAMGVAAGIAPQAHIAAYKVCNNGCPSHIVAHGMEEALEHGVDAITISIGSRAERFHNDLKAIFSFAAIKKGVVVTMSAGNNGPLDASVHNIAPWVLTVGSSTMDRRIRAIVKLGNGSELVGESAYQPSNIPDCLPLTFPLSTEDADAPYCTNAATLKHIGVKGKIVVCKDGKKNRIKAGTSVKEAGGAAMIFLGSRGYDTRVYAHRIRASYVSHADGSTIFEYYKSTGNATAAIRFEGTVFDGSSDPAVAAFSSRGPSKVHHGILKPDIIGPGVNILSAQPRNVGVSPADQLFAIESGTSMSCPHLAGVAALLKNSHPDWSPAMIKSAIMTTADVMNSGGHPLIDLKDKKKASFFAMGAGQVNPVRANNPGLVYDIQPNDYISYLCGLKYTNKEVGIITSNHSISCADYPKINEANLNYPSITVDLSTASNSTAQIQRTLTNVGSTHSTYTAHVHSPHGITIDVKPDILQFSSVDRNRSFCVHFCKNTTEKAPTYAEAYLIWTSSLGSIKVTSPIIIKLA